MGVGEDKGQDAPHPFGHPFNAFQMPGVIDWLPHQK
jgi:hypothetical protein